MNEIPRSPVWVEVHLTDREAEALLAKAKSAITPWSVFRSAASGYALRRAIKHLDSAIVEFKMRQSRYIRETYANVRDQDQP